MTVLRSTASAAPIVLRSLGGGYGAMGAERVWMSNVRRNPRCLVACASHLGVLCGVAQVVSPSGKSGAADLSFSE